MPQSSFAGVHPIAGIIAIPKAPLVFGLFTARVRASAPPSPSSSRYCGGVRELASSINASQLLSVSSPLHRHRGEWPLPIIAIAFSGRYRVKLTLTQLGAVQTKTVFIGVLPIGLTTKRIFIVVATEQLSSASVLQSSAWSGQSPLLIITVIGPLALKVALFVGHETPSHPHRSHRRRHQSKTLCNPRRLRRWCRRRSRRRGWVCRTTPVHRGG